MKLSKHIIDTVYRTWLNVQQDYPKQTATFWEEETIERLYRYNRRLNFITTNVVKEVLEIKGNVVRQ